jgi:hypothetical protein
MLEQQALLTLLKEAISKGLFTSDLLTMQDRSKNLFRFVCSGSVSYLFQIWGVVETGESRTTPETQPLCLGDSQVVRFLAIGVLTTTTRWPQYTPRGSLSVHREGWVVR